MGILENIFKIEKNETTIRKELIAGLATFLTMAYIIVVNPLILQDAGMDFGAVFTATILTAAIATAIMGFWANWPIALAPGMGLNAFFAYGVVLGMGHSWQVALGAVFCSGILFLIISLTPLRQWIIEAIPSSLRYGIGAGIGFFLAIIGLKNAGIVVASDATLVTLGNLADSSVFLACIGFIAMVALDKLKVPGSIVISIIGITIIGLITGDAKWGGGSFLPPDMSPTFLALDIGGVFTAGLYVVVLTFLFVDFFDTAGTLTSVANVSGKIGKDGKIQDIDKAMLSDSVGTVAGSLLGTSTVTTYVESAAGVKAGGRTGMTSLTIGVLFLLCLFFSPLATSLPKEIDGAALIYIATLFVRNIVDIEWDDIAEAGPAVLAMIAMPFTYSISHGIALAFISYAAIKICTGKTNVSPAIWVIAIASVISFVVA